MSGPDRTRGAHSPRDGRSLSAIYFSNYTSVDFLKSALTARHGRPTRGHVRVWRSFSHGVTSSSSRLASRDPQAETSTNDSQPYRVDRPKGHWIVKSECAGQHGAYDLAELIHSPLAQSASPHSSPSRRSAQTLSVNSQRPLSRSPSRSPGRPPQKKNFAYLLRPDNFLELDQKVRVHLKLCQYLAHKSRMSQSRFARRCPLSLRKTT